MRIASLVVAAALLAPGWLDAQVGSTADVLTGVVTGDTGRPLPDAVVEATSLETEITRQVRTDPRGRSAASDPGTVGGVAGRFGPPTG